MDTATEIAPNVWKMGRGFVEHHPERPEKQWDSEWVDDEMHVHVRHHEHALDAVRVLVA